MKLTKSQEEALNFVKEQLKNPDSKYISIKGSPGTGKSFFISVLYDYLQKLLLVKNSLLNKDAQVYLTATTNKAKEQLKEQLKNKDITVTTIHNLFKLYVGQKEGKSILLVKNSLANINKNSYVIIDEASMCNRPLLGFIEHARKEYNLTIIFVGDPYQLPPVREKESKAFTITKDTSYELTDPIRNTHPSFNKQLDLLKDAVINNRITLPQYDSDIFIKTSAEEFKELILQHKDLFEESITNPSAVQILTYTNRAANTASKYVLDILGKTYKELGTYFGEMIYPMLDYEAKTGNFSYIREGIKVRGENNGAEIIVDEILWHKTQEKYFVCPNKTKRQISHLLNENKYFIDENNNAIGPIYHIKVNTPFATTVHKIQGTTLDTAFINLEDILSCTQHSIVPRLIYVALSRSKNKSYIYHV